MTAISGGGAALVMFVFVICVLVCSRRRAQQKPHDFHVMIEALTDIQMDGERRIPREIKRAAVKTVALLGKGNFGEVHKGILSEILGKC